MAKVLSCDDDAVMSCVCKSDLITPAEASLYTCISTLYPKNSNNIDKATNLYLDYCSFAGFKKALPSPVTSTKSITESEDACNLATPVTPATAVITASPTSKTFVMVAPPLLSATSLVNLSEWGILLVALMVSSTVHVYISIQLLPGLPPWYDLCSCSTPSASPISSCSYS